MLVAREVYDEVHLLLTSSDYYRLLVTLDLHINWPGFSSDRAKSRGRLYIHRVKLDFLAERKIYHCG